MENLMQTQELRLIYQMDTLTNERVMYKINADFNNSIIVVGHTKYGMSASNTLITKTVRSLVKLPTVEPKIINRYIQYLLNDKIAVDNLEDRDKIAENYDNGVEFTLGIPARIATQEFALLIPRYVTGKAQDCLTSYIAMLTKYAKYDSLVIKLTNTIRWAVRKHDSALLKKLMNLNTGLFDVALLKTLDVKDLGAICSFVDMRLHQGTDKTKKNVGILKRQTAGAPSLTTTSGEFILVTTLFLDNKDNFEKFPDKFVEHDRNSKEFIQYRIDTVTEELNKPSLTQEPTEDTEETPEANFEAGETVTTEKPKKPKGTKKDKE